MILQKVKNWYDMLQQLEKKNRVAVFATTSKSKVTGVKIYIWYKTNRYEWVAMDSITESNIDPAIICYLANANRLYITGW